MSYQRCSDVVCRLGMCETLLILTLQKHFPETGSHVSLKFLPVWHSHGPHKPVIFGRPYVLGGQTSILPISQWSPKTIKKTKSTPCTEIEWKFKLIKKRCYRNYTYYINWNNQQRQLLLKIKNSSKCSTYAFYIIFLVERKINTNDRHNYLSQFTRFLRTIS